MEDELLEMNLSPAGDHLSLAAELHLRACDALVANEYPWSWAMSRRWALSSVLHAYCGLDSAINLIGHEILFDSDSPRHIPDSGRDLLLRRFVRGWSTSLPCFDKIVYVLSVEGRQLDARLENEIRELNNFRNMIAHGTVYKSTVLAIRHSESSFTGVDREDSIDWAAKLPNTKFNAIDLIDTSDSREANRIVLEVVKQITANSGSRCYVAPYWRGTPGYRVINSDFDIAAFLDSWKQPNPPAT